MPPSSCGTNSVGSNRYSWSMSLNTSTEIEVEVILPVTCKRVTLMWCLCSQIRAVYNAFDNFCDLPDDVRNTFRRIGPCNHGYVLPGVERWVPAVWVKSRPGVSLSVEPLRLVTLVTIFWASSSFLTVLANMEPYKLAKTNKDRHKYWHNLELHNIKPSVAGCIFYNKLPNNIKQIQNNNQFSRELKKLLIKGRYYSLQDYLNEEFATTAYWYKQNDIMYKNVYPIRL
jgi:hypothetical protein